METKFSYYAIFESFGKPDPDKDVGIRFPDVRGAFSQGDSYEDGERMARECLALHLLTFLEEGEPFPPASQLETLSHGPNEVLRLIEGDVRDYFPEDVAKLEKPKKRGGARPGAGRPKKIEGRYSAEKSVTFRITVDEFEMLETLATKRGVSKTEFFRLLLKEEAVRTEKKTKKHGNNG